MPSRAKAVKAVVVAQDEQHVGLFRPADASSEVHGTSDGGKGNEKLIHKIVQRLGYELDVANNLICLPSAHTPEAQTLNCATIGARKPGQVLSYVNHRYFPESGIRYETNLIRRLDRLLYCQQHHG